jgi:hypothetical protein
VALARQETAQYTQDPKSASEVLAIGESPVEQKWAPTELAAWTLVASTILNLDEVITKE